MKIAYLAGPYRAKNHAEVSENILAAARVARYLWELGLPTFCPHLNTAHFDGVCDDSVFLEAGLEFLRRCDCLVLMGSPIDLHIVESKGTQSEIIEAGILDLPVFEWPYDKEAIVKWLKS